MKSSSTVLLFAALLSLVLVTDPVLAYQQGSRRASRDPRQCRIQRLTASRPSRKIQSEGGVTELWDENEEQFQCAGVAAMRNVIQPNSLSLPNYSPSPRLVYIQKGQGVLGISYPGCAETYDSEEEQSGRRRRSGDQHQKVHRIRRGEIVAIPAGAAHWCYNDGNEELVAVSITDVNSQSNQLDQNPRVFRVLIPGFCMCSPSTWPADSQASGSPRRGKDSRRENKSRGRENDDRGDKGEGRERARRVRVREESESESSSSNAQNILSAFDANVIAQAFNVPNEIARRLTREDNRGS
ncbi:hypothetical protein QJS10_CPB21g00039 [Acorus calamus]|uniref:Cupin type-1 domain-containing protein n=1 Tax=Acorus calamus TaxID=4465 RepID=A0AAV9C437_ACOCL|nr:hypothetical protein QJS10_CPB21g00039 [Acorus calamus]